MNTKIFRSRFFILIILAVIISNITIPAVNQTNKTETTLKNQKNAKTKTVSKNNNETKINYYSEKEIRDELKKAGVNSKSIEAFIIANNHSKNKNITKDELKKEFQKALKYDSKNYLALDAMGHIYFDEEDKGIFYFEKAIMVNPKFQKSYANLIYLLSFIDDEESEKKKSDFLRKRELLSEQLIKLAPENPIGYERLYEYYDKKYEYYNKKEDYDKAVTMAKKAIELYLKAEEPKYYYYEVDKPSDLEYVYTKDHSMNVLEFRLLNTYIEKDDITAFDYFFELYKKERKDPEKYSGLKEDFKGAIQMMNREYKNKNRKLYEENLRKFKELGF